MDLVIFFLLICNLILSVSIYLQTEKEIDNILDLERYLRSINKKNKKKGKNNAR